MIALKRTVFSVLAASVLGPWAQLSPTPARASEVTIGRFPPLQAVESTLQRGATRNVVRSALGEPSGTGQARIPPDHAQREVWYYEDIEIEDATSQEGYVHMDMRQRILLVFFDGNRVDGYIWTSNRGEAEAKIR